MSEQERMIWPEHPTCHGTIDPVFRYSDLEVAGWRPRGPYRVCWYCGSLHPEDLLTVLAAGARLEGSDWKYGYPHKFYVRGAGVREAVKFYTDHLRDAGYSESALTHLLNVLTRYSGIAWSRDSEGRVCYRAPFPRYLR